MANYIHIVREARKRKESRCEDSVGIHTHSIISIKIHFEIYTILFHLFLCTNVAKKETSLFSPIIFLQLSSIFFFFGNYLSQYENVFKASKNKQAIAKEMTIEMWQILCISTTKVRRKREEERGEREAAGLCRWGSYSCRMSA